jgi:hypothetical protein
MKNGGESGLDELSEVEFAGRDKLGGRAERDAAGQPEADLTMARLAVLEAVGPKEEKELTPKEAQDEYVKLVMELGQDMLDSNPDIGKNMSGLYTTYSTTDEGFLGKNGYLQIDRHGTTGYEKATAFTAVKNALDAEIAWEEGGKQYTDAKKALVDWDEAQPKSFLKKIFGRGKRKRERQQLMDEVWRAQKKVKGANVLLEKSLAVGYEEGIRGDYKKKDNGQLNERFFAEDRMEKIHRAMELRKKYLSDGNKLKRVIL